MPYKMGHFGHADREQTPLTIPSSGAGYHRIKRKKLIHRIFFLKIILRLHLLYTSSLKGGFHVLQRPRHKPESASGNNK